MMEKVSPAEIQSHLKGVDYPASKAELKKYAEDHGADQDVMYYIDKLPEQDYNSPVDVTKEVGKIE